MAFLSLLDPKLVFFLAFPYFVFIITSLVSSSIFRESDNYENCIIEAIFKSRPFTQTQVPNTVHFYFNTSQSNFSFSHKNLVTFLKSPFQTVALKFFQFPRFFTSFIIVTISLSSHTYYPSPAFPHLIAIELLLPHSPR